MRWAEVAQAALRDAQPLLAAALAGSRPVALANGILTVECPADFCDRADDDALQLQSLGTVVAHVCGQRLGIRVRPPPGHGGGRSARYQAAEANPLVQALRRHFAADVITREPISREDWLRRTVGVEADPASQPPVRDVDGV
jgi:hypothetical protein